MIFAGFLKHQVGLQGLMFGWCVVFFCVVGGVMIKKTSC